MPYKEYGEVKARVEKINRTPYYDKTTQTSYYEVLAKISPLAKDKKHMKLEQGMITEAFVVTGKEKILFKLLEKLNLR